MLIYKGEATDVSEMSEADAAAVMDKWGAWIAKVGPALVDVGAPFGSSVSVVDDGSVRAAISLTGYSIVESVDLNGARALADGHPYLSEGAGNFAIDIFELVPVPFEV
jgi:hypothetical protein